MNTLHVGDADSLTNHTTPLLQASGRTTAATANGRSSTAAHAWTRSANAPTNVRGGNDSVRGDDASVSGGDSDSEEVVQSLEDTLDWRVKGLLRLISGRWPDINGDSPLWMYRAVLDKQKEIWRGMKGERILIQFAGASPQDHLVKDCYRTLLPAAKEFLQKITGNSNIKISPGIAQTSPTRINDPPYTCLVHGLSVPERDLLLSLPAWIAPEFGLFTRPYAEEVKCKFVGTATGFGGQSGDDVLAALVDQVQSAEVMQDVIRDIRPNFPRHLRRMPMGDLMEFVAGLLELNALDMTVILDEADSTSRTKNKLTVLHHKIYIDLPSSKNSDILLFREAFAKLDFIIPTIGHGEFVRPEGSSCPICHAADHPRGHCPWPSLPGWHGPGLRPPQRAPPPSDGSGPGAPPPSRKRERGTSRGRDEAGPSKRPRRGVGRR